MDRDRQIAQRARPDPERARPPIGGHAPVHRKPPQASEEHEEERRRGPWDRSFLGFTIRNDPEFRRCIADKALVRFKHRVRRLTGGTAASVWSG